MDRQSQPGWAWADGQLQGVWARLVSRHSVVSDEHEGGTETVNVEPLARRGAGCCATGAEREGQGAQAVDCREHADPHDYGIGIDEAAGAPVTTEDADLTRHEWQPACSLSVWS